MEKPIIESVPTQDLLRIADEIQRSEGGDYTAAWGMVNREMQRRTAIIEAMHAVDMAYLVPEDPADSNECSGCE